MRKDRPEAKLRRRSHKPYHNASRRGWYRKGISHGHTGREGSPCRQKTQLNGLKLFSLECGWNKFQGKSPPALLIKDLKS
ncbi:hypothetical protein MLD38_016046 [Melastoma candidum]|uniref:Uncharacterized protein n=1 Tax=Melastoma candidum TaxID=119954 RepID=A0ACB9RHE1_9MYRT|nr:hypothetical protein MLD38_016046 [Melastoma candidum]